MARLMLTALVLLLAGLAGCSPNDDRPDWEPKKLFDNRDQAIQQYIKDESFHGTLIQLNIVDGRKLIISKEKQGIYYIGEFIERDNRIAAVKISPGFDLSQASWVKGEFESMDGPTYTISIFKEHLANALYVKELKAWVVVLEGNHQSDPQGTVPMNTALSYENYE